MNISYNWLKDLIDTELSPAEVDAALTRVGLTVEGTHPVGNDHVLDIDLTSNRSDCLSHLGVARELAVITDSKLQISNSKPSTQMESGITNLELVQIEDPDICHRFTARLIRGVKIGPSPEWLVKRLEAVGERSINNVADITNFVMHELGQPMHSFDLNKLARNRIVVRRARAGESIQTLDEVERKLDETMLVICDAEKPAAVGGVMGGLGSSITDDTTDVLLEVAYFKRENIRQTSRKLKLSTEASHRFERGTDIENLIAASNRATELIVELAGGTAGEFVDVYPTKFIANEIESKDIAAAVKKLTGLSVEREEVLRILSALGISQKSDTVFVQPSWRHDIAIEQDLVEEVARHIGYENIADELPPAYGAGEYQPTENRKKALRRTMADMGFDEAISYSFINTDKDETFEFVPGLVDENAEEKFVTLQDSIIEGAVRMRPTLLAGLLDGVRTNFNYQRKDVKLFELGKVFATANSEDSLPVERELLSLVITGGDIGEDRVLAKRELDFYDAKGALEAALESVNAPAPSFAAKDVKHLRKGQSAEIQIAGKPVGTLGRLSDELASGYKFRQPVYLAEVDLQALLALPTEQVLYKPLPKYPGIVRDVSFLMKRSMSFAEIRSAIEAMNVELCQSVEYVDVYEGKGMADDERSLTIRLEYRSPERTLVDEEVDAAHAGILTGLENALGVKPRF
jgi:phenylalanyl-tRNA synthetase beta chain